MADIVTSDITPSRKRKRDHEKASVIGKNVCFTNSAFNASSTPKKIIGRRRLLPPGQENINPLNICMEVKSIAELVEKQKEEPNESHTLPYNPYEVQRKPPNKKKRKAAIEEACFENPALNLNVLEKQFNPFEVVRDVGKSLEDQRKCFVNAALDIKGQDATIKVRNPFEIDRENSKHNSTQNEIAPAKFELNSPQPTALKIGIPFKPTVGCRIDFNNIPLTQLTPSKLLFTEKLIFSPVQGSSALPKRSLDAISEESSSISIGKELDRYQLELENSINEAKMRKHDHEISEPGVAEKESVYQLQLRVEKRVSLSTKLSDIAESEEFEMEKTEQTKETELLTEIIQPELENKAFESSSQGETNHLTLKADDGVLEANDGGFEADLNTYNNCNPGFDFDSEVEESIDYKAPAPFVRAYRRDNASKSNSKESLNSNKSTKSSSNENIAETKKRNLVKNLIRKSIRKMLPNNHQADVGSGMKQTTEEHESKDNEEKHCTLKSHIISSIRQSLHRRPKPKGNIETPNPAESLAEISIIDTSERKMKFKSSLTQNEYARVEELTNERKHLLSHGSLRHSTREMGHQIMKTLFQHKQEEYSFKK